MIIGINASAAIKQPRTGVEEYCCQLLKHLTMLPEAKEHRFFLYVPKSDPNCQNLHPNDPNRKISPNPPLQRGEGGGIFDFELPENFEVKMLSWPLPMWTQVRLASEVIFNKPDVLFIPVHILPLIHLKNSVVTIHGLEYEYFPEYYSVWFKNYLRHSTKYAVKHARKIIAVSENTKNDLVKLYGADSEKITVIHHGYCLSGAPPFTKGGAESKAGWQDPSTRPDNTSGLAQGIKFPYLLHIGRVELKKNILGILEAYKILKEKYKIPHELVLAGVPGFGYSQIKSVIETFRLRSGYNVREPGYVRESEKWQLLANADAFIFPSFYEGFGLPILEAQSAGVPVVASNTSSIPEIVGDSATLIDPKNPEEIAEAVYKIIDGKALRDKLIESGYKNIGRFSWQKCARETLRILTLQ